jgi:polyphosphate kinase 2 (PPK2 family)
MAMAAKSFASLTAPYRRASPRASFGLKAIDPGATPLSLGSDDTDNAEVDKLARRLADLRDVFHADRRFRLLVVLQGLDASGKDGTLRRVFGRMGPQALRSIGWRSPSPAERAHDPLWRIHQAVPADGGAYDEVLGRTCTRWAPWTVVPADSKLHRNLMVAAVLVERLSRLGLRYPAGDPGWVNRRIR